MAWIPWPDAAPVTDPAPPGGGGAGTIDPQLGYDVGTGLVAVQDAFGNVSYEQPNSTTGKLITDFLNELTGGGGGGGGGDPFAALNSVMAKIATLINLGQLSDKEGIDVFEQAYTIAQQQQQQWQNTAEQERMRTSANIERGIDLQSEATKRANTVLDIFGASAPVSELNIPMLAEMFGGPVRGTKLDLNALFNQGQGNLADTPVMPMAAPSPALPQYAPPQPALGGPVDVGAMIRGLLGQLA